MKKGQKHSKESENKMVLVRKSKNNPFYGKRHTEETRKKMRKNHVNFSGKNNPFYGKKHSEESIEKMSKAKINKDNPNWKGGTTIVDGYRMILIENSKYIQEHRLIMEHQIGRKLNSDEIVHHKDLNKLNNEIDNLQIMTQSKHTKLHNKLKRE